MTDSRGGIYRRVTAHVEQFNDTDGLCTPLTWTT